MKTTLLIILLSNASLLLGQSIDQQVIGFYGNFSSNSAGTTLSSTAGEVITTTATSATAILTQGFQQPVIITSLQSTKTTDNKEIKVYPNPSSHQITIEKKGTETVYVELIDLLGQIISVHQLSQKSSSINLEKLASGTYFLKIMDKDKEQTVQTFKIQKIQ